MNRVDCFTVDAAGGEKTATARLLFSGRFAGTVHGSRIDAQFQVLDIGYLVLVSFGDMFSAIETVYFVDSTLKIRDSIRFGHSMAQGLIAEIEAESTDIISFRFPGDELRRVRVGRRAEWLGLRTRWLASV